MNKFKWLIIDFFVLSIIFALSITIVVLGKWNWQWIAIFFIILHVINSIFVIISVGDKVKHTEKMSWIFFIVCVPYIGFVFYMLFRIRRDDGIKIDEYEKELKEFIINDYTKDKIGEEIGEWQSSLVKRNFYDTDLVVFENGYDAYKKLLDDVKNAKKYIHIQMYIVKESEIYEKLKEILFLKLKEGIEVKIIFDKFGSWKIPIDEFKYLKYMGIELCFFNVPIYPYVRHTDNKRLQKKFFIIDGEIIHFGGLNITDEYCSMSKKYGYWADTNFRATGKMINDYESYFLYDWYKITKNKLDKSNYINTNEIQKSNAKILSFQESPRVQTTYLEDSITHWINSSKKSIKLITPYFIPTDTIYKVIKNALRRNVNVEIYIPGKPDKKFTYKATLYYTNKLAKYGANIFVINNTFLHSKFGVFDNEYAYIGTNNLDMRSFYTNQEGINLLYGKKVINKLNKLTDFYKDISTNKKYKKSLQIKKVYNQFIFKLFAPLI